MFLLFSTAAGPLKVCNVGEQRQPKVEQDGSEKCAGGVWCIPLAVPLPINLRIA